MPQHYDVRSAMQLYFIAGTQDVSHLAGDPADNLLHVLEQALQSGITCYQFREKGAKSLHDPAACKALAIRCRDLCRQYKVPFVIDDNVDLAVEIGADGIHVGQTDMPPEDVKKRCGEHCFVGTSVNTLKQGIAAQANPFVDYFGTGPIFPTQSKEDPKPVVTPDFVTKIRENGISKPIVAIGGITADTASLLRAKGADGVAIISAITCSSNIPQTVKELLK